MQLCANLGVPQPTRWAICVHAGKPGLLDLKGRKKWDAWNGKKGMARNIANPQGSPVVATLYAAQAADAVVIDFIQLQLTVDG